MNSVPTLDELARDPTRAAELAPEVARSLYAQANALAGTLLARALTGGSEALKSDNETPDMLTVDQAATLANVPASWIRSEIRAGRLPSVKLGHYRRIPRDEFLHFLDVRRRPYSNA